MGSSIGGKDEGCNILSTVVLVPYDNCFSYCLSCPDRDVYFGVRLTFYNDTEQYVAEWLRNLTLVGEISSGDVCTTPIQELEGWQLAGYTRCHLFAGIGGWDYALKLAGWPNDLPVWTGSCPCQPFSVAGKRKGTSDERHLWPYFRNLIEQCRPSIIFGEQVASKDGRIWLAGVRSDLEALGYAVGAADLCAAGVGAPHIRQRLYWMAYTEAAKWRRMPYRKEYESYAQAGGRGTLSGEESARPRNGESKRSGVNNSGLEHSASEQERFSRRAWESRGTSIRLGDSNNNNKRSQRRGFDIGERTDQRSAWAAGEFIRCIDGKERRFEPGVFPLAHGLSNKSLVVGCTIQEPYASLSEEERNHRINRIGVLRGAGNAIVPPLAAEFIKGAMDVLGIS